jgi:hypothetical protein
MWKSLAPAVLQAIFCLRTMTDVTSTRTSKWGNVGTCRGGGLGEVEHSLEAAATGYLDHRAETGRHQEKAGGFGGDGGRRRNGRGGGDGALGAVEPSGVGSRDRIPSGIHGGATGVDPAGVSGDGTGREERGIGVGDVEGDDEIVGVGIDLIGVVLGTAKLEETVLVGEAEGGTDGDAIEVADG